MGFHVSLGSVSTQRLANVKDSRGAGWDELLGRYGNKYRTQTVKSYHLYLLQKSLQGVILGLYRDYIL